MSESQLIEVESAIRERVGNTVMLSATDATALLQLARTVSDSQRARVDGVVRMLDGVSVLTTPKLTAATLRPLMGQTVALVPVPTTEGK